MSLSAVSGPAATPTATTAPTPTAATSATRIRPYEAADRDGMLQVILPIFNQEFGIRFTAERNMPELLDLRQAFSHGHSNFWVAAADSGEIVGMIGMKDIGNQQCAIQKLYVKAAYRGQPHAVGRLLLQTVIEWAWAHDMDSIYLVTVEKFKAAQRFYEKNGFVAISRDELPATVPVTVHDTHDYVLHRPR